MKTVIRFFDMFSGIGGFRTGLERCGGYECVGHCELDNFANKSYNAVFDTEGEVFFDDATKIDPKDIPEFDLLCAGFPCQAFSVAGRRRGFEDARGTLIFEIVRVLGKKRPKYFLLENVPGLLNHDKGRTFTQILTALSDLGYGIEWQVLNSADFNVPQTRKRVFIIGYLDERCRGKILPFTECNPQTASKILDGNQGQRVYDPDGLGITLAANAGGQGGKTGLYDVSCIDMNEEPMLTRLVRCIKSRYNSGITKRKGENSGIIEGVMPCLTPAKLYKRQNGPRFRGEGELMFTITATDRHGVLEKLRVRKLMPQECLRAQGFSEKQAKIICSVNSDNQVYKQAGNAVTVTVVQAIGERLRTLDEELKRGGKIYGL